MGFTAIVAFVALALALPPYLLAAREELQRRLWQRQVTASLRAGDARRAETRRRLEVMGVVLEVAGRRLQERRAARHDARPGMTNAEEPSNAEDWVTVNRCVV